jgi:chromosome partitioning protein
MNEELVGLGEIAALAGVTRQAVSNWRARYDHFPLPFQSLQSGPVWHREKIERWIKMFNGEETHVLSFINLKGGVGKTTTAVAVAEILAHEHRKHVLLIDLDPQTNATVNLISEDKWDELDKQGRTIAQLFDDKVNPFAPPRFNIEDSVVRGVSTINGGIERLDLLPSSIRLIDLQDRIPMIAMAGNFTANPLDILKNALQPVMGRYDYVIIDCPPSLGTVTKNGLRISSGYVIPTIPDIVSTWGIYQIVENVKRFGQELGQNVEPLGIVATKVQGNNLHTRVVTDLTHGRLGKFASAGVMQPPLFKNKIRQAVAVARGADPEVDLRTFKGKYGPAYEELQGLTQEIRTLCEAKSL